MRGVAFRALVHVEGDEGQQLLVDVGSTRAVDPDRVIAEIEQRRDDGELELPGEAEVWVVPDRSFMDRMAVPATSTSTTDDGKIHYVEEEDRQYGEEYVALRPTGEGEYVLEGRVRAVKPEIAARVAASLRGGRPDGKRVVLVPHGTISEYTVAPSE